MQPRASSQDWFNQAQTVDAFTVDIWFVIHKAFYIGDENDCEQVMSGDSAINLPLPAVSYARFAEGSRSGVAKLADAMTNQSELVAYFKALVGLCYEHGKRPSTKKLYFWLRPMISESDACLVHFPWYDTYGEFKHWADAMLTSNEPQAFWDGDQGWELEVWQTDEHFYFRRGNLDDPDEEADCYRFSKLDLRAQIEALDNSCTTTLKTISEQIGLDFMDIDKSLTLLDDKVRQSNIRREPERIEAAPIERPWWKFWE